MTLPMLPGQRRLLPGPVGSQCASLLWLDPVPYGNIEQATGPGMYVVRLVDGGGTGDPLSHPSELDE